MKAIRVISLIVFICLLLSFALSLFDIFEISPKWRGPAGIAAVISLGLFVKTLKRRRRYIRRN